MPCISKTRTTFFGPSILRVISNPENPPRHDSEGRHAPSETDGHIDATQGQTRQSRAELVADAPPLR